MNKRTVYILFHPATLALVITIIIILFLPPVFNKYQARIIESKKTIESEIYSYYDLNFDGYSEEILYQRSLNNYHSIIIRDKGKILNQWNFEGTIINQNQIYCDYNSDSVSEIFVFTVNNDSIFLTGISPYKTEESIFIKKFVDISKPFDGRYNCAAYFCDSPDDNDDGYKELVFSIITGISKQPRNLYLLDLFNDTIIKSPASGTAVNLPVAFDINNDENNEYFGESCAHGNYHKGDSMDYPDTCAWLMVFDRNMNFLFTPKKFGQYKTILDIKPFRPFKTNYIVVLQKHQGPENIDNKLILFTTIGNKKYERILEDFIGIESSFLISRDKIRYNDLYLFFSNGQIESIDSNLNIVSTVSLPDILHERPTPIDVDLDGTDEFVFMTKDMQGLIITRNDFTFPVKLEFTTDKKGGARFSINKQGYENPKLFIQFVGNGYFIEYSKNPLYHIKYLIWFGIYAIIFIILFLLQKVQNIRAQKKFETEQRLAKLQLKSIKGQTDPHFTLNLIDSIGNLFYKQDSEKAAYVFGKYAKLLRTTILSSEKISVSLEKEIEYVKNYMDLEKFRYDDKFNYNIEIDKKANTQVEIPKMLIHTFVENAIKHGLKHKGVNGKLDISIEKQKKSIKVTISDNGIGRQKAKEYSKLSTGKGLKILDNMLELYYDLRKSKISYQITDLNKDDGQPDGTLVTINIPLKARK